MEAKRTWSCYAGWLFVLVLSLVAVVDRRSHARQDARLALNSRIDETIRTTYTNVAQAYFQAGVSSAQLAYREWQHAALASGHLPTEYATDEWKAAATRTWLAINTNEHYIKAP
jgi:hypothetical protein